MNKYYFWVFSYLNGSDSVETYGTQYAGTNSTDQYFRIIFIITLVGEIVKVELFFFHSSPALDYGLLPAGLIRAKCTKAMRC